jgi:hypothetical protein
VKFSVRPWYWMLPTEVQVAELRALFGTARPLWA